MTYFITKTYLSCFWKGKMIVWMKNTYWVCIVPKMSLKLCRQEFHLETFRNSAKSVFHVSSKDWKSTFLRMRPLSPNLEIRHPGSSRRLSAMRKISYSGLLWLPRSKSPSKQSTASAENSMQRMTTREAFINLSVPWNLLKWPKPLTLDQKL